MLFSARAICMTQQRSHRKLHNQHQSTIAINSQKKSYKNQSRHRDLVSHSTRNSTLRASHKSTSTIHLLCIGIRSLSVISLGMLVVIHTLIFSKYFSSKIVLTQAVWHHIIGVASE
jgi:hypothetical protein